MAGVVGRVFDPVVEIPVLLGGAVWWALTNGARWRFLALLLVVDALLPAVYMVWGLKTGRISNWDIRKKEERRELYFLTVFAHLFGVVLAFLIGKYVLFKILLVFWSLAVVFAIVTYFWKISVHAGTNAALVAFCNHFYGWDRYWWLVGVLLLVLWARVEGKNHDWGQVLVGAGMALAWVSLGLQLV